MLGYGYDPMLSEGAVRRPPVFRRRPSCSALLKKGATSSIMSPGRKERSSWWRSGGLSIHDLIIPIAKSLRIGLRSMPGAEGCDIVLIWYVGNLDNVSGMAYARPGDVIFPLPATLWWHGDTSDEDVRAVRH